MARTRFCSTCGIEKSTDDFYKRSNRPVGITSVCKVCENNRVKQSRKTLKGRLRANVNSRKNYWKNPEKTRKRSRDYSKKHREEISKRRRENPKYVLNNRISMAIRHSLKEGKNGKHWEDLVGYTLEDLIKHLKTTLPVGYTWDDYINGADLHIDHIIPIKAFKFQTFGDNAFKSCWNLCNLQLLTAQENLIKHDKINYSLCKRGFRYE